MWLKRLLLRDEEKYEKKAYCERPNTLRAGHDNNDVDTND